MATPPEPTIIALAKLTLDHREKIIALLMSSGVAVAIPAAVTCYTAYLENSTKQIDLLIQREEKTAAATAKVREQELAETQFRHKAISDFATYGLNQDIELRIRLAEYFAELSEGPVQGKWRTYLTALSAKRDTVVASLEATNAKIDTLSASSVPDLLALKKALRTKTTLEAAFNPIVSGVPVTVMDASGPPPTNEGLTTVPDAKLIEWFGGADASRSVGYRMRNLAKRPAQRADAHLVGRGTGHHASRTSPRVIPQGNAVGCPHRSGGEGAHQERRELVRKA